MKEFVSDSGRFVCKTTFLERNPKAKIFKHCSNVVYYSNGQYIQVLKSGLFYVDENFSSYDLNECEKILAKKTLLLNEN